MANKRYNDVGWPAELLDVEFKCQIVRDWDAGTPDRDVLRRHLDVQVNNCFCWALEEYLMGNDVEAARIDGSGEFRCFFTCSPWSAR